MKRLFVLIVVMTGFVTAAPSAQEKRFALEAAPELVESGALKFILPRFSLKTGVRVQLVEADGTATLLASATGDRRYISEAMILAAMTPAQKQKVEELIDLNRTSCLLLRDVAM